jgi:hypothetical protein
VQPDVIVKARAIASGRSRRSNLDDDMSADMSRSVLTAALTPRHALASAAVVTRGDGSTTWFTTGSGKPVVLLAFYASAVSRLALGGG